MMNKIEALIEALTDLAIAATAHLGGLPATVKPAAEQPAAPAEEKKARKPRAAKESTAAVDAAALGDDKGGAGIDLGLGAVAPEEPKKKEPELTEEQSFAEMVKSVKAYIAVAKNDKPADGTAQLKAMLAAEPFKVGKIQDLTHPQRMAVIAKVDGMVTGHK